MSYVLSTPTVPGTAIWTPVSGNVVFAASYTNPAFSVLANTTAAQEVSQLALTIPAGTMQDGDILSYAYTGYFGFLAQQQTAYVGAKVTNLSSDFFLGAKAITTTANDYTNVAPQIVPVPVQNGAWLFTVQSLAQNEIEPITSYLTMRYCFKSFSLASNVTITPAVQYTAVVPGGSYFASSASITVVRPG